MMLSFIMFDMTERIYFQEKIFLERGIFYSLEIRLDNETDGLRKSWEKLIKYEVSSQYDWFRKIMLIKQWFCGFISKISTI